MHRYLRRRNQNARHPDVLAAQRRERAWGADGILYTAPNLLIHYITEHQYCPPEEFCRAAARTVGIETAGQLTLAD
ncbi:DUF7919 family protein [Streptomyces sp. NBC_01224]|uniref:DUF7919 family protein n=1 Tax=Streptomyces sp. NBC_01224 TaxID=2903783 RepID=UPI003FA3A124